MKGLSKGRYDETFAGEDVGVTDRYNYFIFGQLRRRCYYCFKDA